MGVYRHSRGRAPGAGRRTSRVRAQGAGTSSRRWHVNHAWNTLQPPDALEVGEEESLVLNDRPAKGSAELIAPQRWLFSAVKEVPRIQRVVAKEFIGRAMNRVRTGTRNGVDNSS